MPVGAFRVGSLGGRVDVFPEVVDSAVSTSAGGATSFPVEVPDHAAGDRLVMFIGCGSVQPNSVATLNGASWSLTSFGLGVGGVAELVAVAEQAEPINVTVTMSGTSDARVARVYRVAGHRSSTAAAVSASAAATSTAPNPPALTPGWGARKALAFVYMRASGSSSTFSSGPSGYTGQQDTASSGGARIWTGWDEFATASVDPPAGVLASSQAWHARTCAVRGG